MKRSRWTVRSGDHGVAVTRRGTRILCKHQPVPSTTCGGDPLLSTHGRMHACSLPSSRSPTTAGLYRTPQIVSMRRNPPHAAQRQPRRSSMQNTAPRGSMRDQLSLLATGFKTADAGREEEEEEDLRAFRAACGALRWQAQDCSSILQPPAVAFRKRSRSTGLHAGRGVRWRARGPIRDRPRRALH
jgi:hypothetical protein